MASQFGVTIPDDVKPQTFFKELLPNILKGAKEAIPGLNETNFKMQVNVDAAKFGITIDKGATSVTEGDLADAIIKLEVSETDWRDTVTGKVDDTGGFTDFKHAGKPQAIHILKNIKGELTVVLTRPGAADMTSKITFNGTAAPKAKMKLSLQDYMDINAKRANGQMLFMQGRIMVEGDMGLIMQLQPLQNL